MLRGWLPGLAVACATAALVVASPVPLDEISGPYARVLYGAGAVLALAFHRSRVLIGLLGLGLLDFAFERGGEEMLVPYGTMLLVVLGALASVRDRGLRSHLGVGQLGASALWLVLTYRAFLDPAHRRAFEGVDFIPSVPFAGALPDLTVAAGAAALLATVWGVVRWRGQVERALLWCVLLAVAALAMGGAASRVLLMGAGLVLALSVLLQTYSMAYRDDLTGLPGRRALMRDLAEAGGTYALAMVDVDHFKGFNDTHGHDVGDQVLQLVATRLAGARGGAKAYRYGGEEFTLLFPGRTREQALPLAEAVRASVERASFALRAWNRPRRKPKTPRPRRRRPRKLSVTVSVGLADSSGGSAGPEAVLREADQALYRAKRSGRNRVET